MKKLKFFYRSKQWNMKLVDKFVILGLIVLVRLQTLWDKIGILLTDTFPEYSRFNKFLT